MTTHQLNKETVYSYLTEVKDPEIPVLSVIDLGIVRDVILSGDDEIEIIITPTYSGCPALDAMATSIRIMLSTLGFKKIKITQTLSPAWTTDWISEEGKRKLKEYGIAPPNPSQQVCQEKLFVPNEAIQCPHCSSWHTHRVSEFGSTPCKSLYVCEDCKEPFDYFKCH
ncbi:MAG TPA: 1,2-phenylacetyl-CoA epoxidase subunit PaaD [Chitinophagaceae bacterium]|jgi:ring-1,2-phenylacetyl-CoA epoxidase subunit PaaD